MFMFNSLGLANFLLAKQVSAVTYLRGKYGFHGVLTVD